MKNLDVADMLDRISGLLEASGEDRYRVIAYRRASNSVRNLAEDIEDLWRNGKLDEIQYIGKSIAERIDEYLRTGSSSYLEALQKQVPEGATELMKIPGVGPRTAFKLVKDFGIRRVDQLGRELASGKLTHELGTLFVQKTLAEIKKLQAYERRMLLADALASAKNLVDYFVGEGIATDVAGSIRRGKSTIGDIDLLATARGAEEVLSGYAKVERVIEKGPTRASVRLDDGTQVDLRVVKESEYGAALVYFTGSKEHNIALRNLAIERGWKLNEYGLFDTRTDQRLAGGSEEEVYSKLGLQYIPPELRENGGEIKAAKEHNLPNLLDPQEIKGDLQVHTSWSDGSDELEAMAYGGKEMGYEYMAITDHSESARIAGGLTRERFLRQWKIIDGLNEKLAPFRILRGVELEVRGDGTLDFDEKFLDEFDIVGASLHQSFRQSGEKLTDRAVRALSHPKVDFLCHPTNRLIGRREGHPLDLAKVIRVARDNGKLLEIDAQPERLDLDEVWSKRAMEEKVSLLIDSDAHSKSELRSMRYGVTIARRAWLEPRNVANTLRLGHFLRLLE